MMRKAAEIRTRIQLAAEAQTAAVIWLKPNTPEAPAVKRQAGNFWDLCTTLSSHAVLWWQYRNNLVKGLELPDRVRSSCPAVCECPVGPTVCPPGVSAVPDGCGCCKVCAAQLNEDCHLSRPCDHHKGLECNYGNDVARTWGVCRALSNTAKQVVPAFPPLESNDL
ncbi:hypothetical protein JZ751_013306 [Albula glossodonta]|uniref:IGFBP N-terminal domain-containing protein n=1 Tax=Albula glossodonta TaxID=121402 RepID=A0A8T2NUN1_9TELE|nr:hypothetical protein JZ751_013306 [Albula glossodonta]